jgi:hypothetical protein
LVIQDSQGMGYLMRCGCHGFLCLTVFYDLAIYLYTMEDVAHAALERRVFSSLEAGRDLFLKTMPFIL